MYLLCVLLHFFLAQTGMECTPGKITQYFVPTVEDTLTAVHFYSWYQQDPSDCVGKSKLESKQWCACIHQLKGLKPIRGFYGSDEKTIVANQLQEMDQHGIDIVSMEWTGRPRETRNFLRTFLPALETHNRERKDDMKFVILYDTSLRLRRSEAIQFDDLKTRRQFVKDFSLFAESSKYFKHHDYLVFNNKPVVYLYVARGIRGSKSNIQLAFDSIQEAVRAQGFSGVLLVADYLYWGKIDYDRLRLMNVSAVTSFAPVDSTQGVLEKASESYRPMRVWADQLARLYSSAREQIAQRNLPVDLQPGIFPQYDDMEKGTPACDPDPPRRRGKQYRLVDGSDWEYMIEKGIEARQASEKKETLPDCKQVHHRNFDGKSIVWIYSYNEWAEGSGIEGVEVKPERYPYGFGSELLSILRKKLP
jgi:hypothetical protein